LTELPASPWHDHGAERLRDLLKAAAEQAGADVYVVGRPNDVSTPAGIRKPDVPSEDTGEGDAWTGQLVNAVARSRYRDSTAIFLTYDEGGGFRDHVPPSYASGYGSRR
jgi:phospholipase C